MGPARARFPVATPNNDPYSKSHSDVSRAPTPTVFAILLCRLAPTLEQRRFPVTVGGGYQLRRPQAETFFPMLWRYDCQGVRDLPCLLPNPLWRLVATWKIPPPFFVHMLRRLHYKPTRPSPAREPRSHTPQTARGRLVTHRRTESARDAARAA